MLSPSPPRAHWDRLRATQRSTSSRVEFPFLIRVQSSEVEIQKSVADMAFGGALFQARLQDGDPAIVFAFGHGANEDFDLMKYLLRHPPIVDDKELVLVYKLKEGETIDSVVTGITLARMRLLEQIPDNDASFILHLNSNGKGYQLMQLLGRGSDGVVYLAKSMDPTFEHTDCSTSHQAPCHGRLGCLILYREKVAFQVISETDPSDPRKLYDWDDEHQVLVMSFIDGPRLYEAMAEADAPTKAKLRAAYLALPGAFLERFGLKHGDVRPNNVMMQPTKVFMLIDFSNSMPVPGQVKRGTKAWTEIVRDEAEYAETELDFYGVEIEAGKALHRPGLSGSLQAAQKYYDVLRERGAEELAEDFFVDAVREGLKLTNAKSCKTATQIAIPSLLVIHNHIFISSTSTLHHTKSI